MKRVEIPKPGGGVRKLGGPTGLARFIQQAVLQGLQPEWDQTVSEGSYGVRPGRSAHQAVARAQKYLGEGYGGVVDLDLEQFFDRVNHDQRMSRVQTRVEARRVLPRLARDRKAAAVTEAGVAATVAGTPPGGPVSPRWANRRRDGLDQEWERRGHRCVRDAEAGPIDVPSIRAGQGVLARVTRFLARQLKLAVNAAQSAVGRPWRRTFLGFTFTGRRPNRRRVSRKAVQACKHEVRQLTSRTRGVSLERVVGELRRYLAGW